MSSFEERFHIPSSWTKYLLGLLGLGILLLTVGILSYDATAHHDAEATHEHAPSLFTHIMAALWGNNVFFTGLALVGVLFVAIHYVSEAGWSTLLKRIPEAMGHWIPFAGITMLLLFFVGHHELFHWTHETLYEPTLPDGSPNPEYDAIIDGKKELSQHSLLYNTHDRLLCHMVRTLLSHTKDLTQRRHRRRHEVLAPRRTPLCYLHYLLRALFCCSRLGLDYVHRHALVQYYVRMVRLRKLVGRRPSPYYLPYYTTQGPRLPSIRK